MTPSDHEPHTAAELREGVDPLAREGLVDDVDLASEEGLPNAPHSGIVITLASMGFFLITLDIGIVNVALARIKADLGGGTTGQQWIIDAYTLLFACLLLFAGNLSDRVGAKRALGLLTSYDWRLVFTINLPVGIAMLFFLAWVAASPRRPQPFDWAGQALAVVGLTGLVYGLIEGGHAGFGSGLALLALTVAVVALVGFVVVQSRVAHPMMPLDLFGAHGFRLALPVGFAFMVGNF
ncbi:MAG: efflux MFS transporter permease, partial [Propionibacteriaceae bacterium]